VTASRIRYHFNVRAALILTVAGLATALGGYALWKYQERRVLSIALEQVKTFQENSAKSTDPDQKAHNNDLALRHLIHYLDFRPDDPDGLNLEAELLTRATDLDGATTVYDQLRQALARDPSYLGTLRGATSVYEHLLRVEPTGPRAQKARRRLAAIYILVSDYIRMTFLARLMPEDMSKEYKYLTAQEHAYNLLKENAEAKTPIEKARAAEVHQLYALALEGQIVRGETERKVPVTLRGEETSEHWTVTVEDGAILEFENALELQPGDVNTAWHLAGLYQKASRTNTDIVTELENLLETLPAGKRPKALDDLLKASSSARRLADLDPKSKNWPVVKETYIGLLKTHSAARRLADLYQGTRKNADIAEEVLDRLRAANDSVDVRRIRYAFFSILGNARAAAAELEEAILLDPENLDLVLLAAENARLSGSGGTYDPHFWLDQVPKSLRDNPRVLLVQGLIEYSEQNYEAALASWRKGLDQTNDADVGLLSRQLALVLLDLNRDDEAAKVIEQYRRLVPDPDTDPVLHFLEGIQDERAGRYSRAIERLERARDRLPQGLQTSVALTLARCQERQGDHAEAEKTYRTALRLDPSSVPLRQSLGRLLLDTQPQETIRELEQGLEFSRNHPGLLLNLAEARLQQQKALPPKQRNWADFDAVFNRAAAVVPSSLALTLLQAERLAADDRLAEAIKQLREAFERNPKSAELALRLTQYLLDQRRVDQALEVRVDQALEVLDRASDPNAAGDRGPLRVQRALALSSRGQGQEARKALLQNLDRLPPSDRDLVWSLLFLLCWRQGDPETTRAAYNAWAQQLPDDPRPKFALLELDIEANNQDEVSARLKSLCPDDQGKEQDTFLCNLAQARQLLMKAKGPDLRLISWGDGSGAPTSGNSLVIVGVDNKGLLHIRIFDAAGNLVTDTHETKLPGTQARAIATLKQQLPGLSPPHMLTSAEKDQVVREVTSIVGQTQATKASNEQNRRELLKAADQRVEKALKNFKVDSVALLLKGVILEAEDAFEKAANAYRQAWDRGNGDALRRLVDLWTRLGRKQELEQLRLEDKTKQLDQIEAMTFLNHGDKNEASRIIEESLKQNPGSQSWQAGMLEYLGKDQKAEAALRSSAEQQSDKLDPWLALIRFQANPRPPRTTASIDRRLKVTEALAELKPLLKDRWRPELLEAECAFAAADWPAADRAFNASRARYPELPEVQAAAKRYADQKGQLEAADACLSRLKAEAYIVRFKPLLKDSLPGLLEARCHFAAADWPGADSAFDAARKRYPEVIEVQAEVARYQAQRGRESAAEACLKHLEAAATIAEIKPLLKDRWRPELLEAQCHFAAADWPAADQAFEKARKGYPEVAEVQEAVAKYQAQKGREDAADACLRHLKIEATIAEIKQRVKSQWPELLDAQCRWTANDLPEADKAFAAAVKGYPGVRDVQAMAARYYEQTGRLETAEACLKRILDRKPGDRDTTRELAIVLASQDGRPDASKRALELLGPENSKTNTPEERLARAIVFRRSGNSDLEKQAINILQTLVADLPVGNTLTATARDLLIRSLLSTGQPDQASKVAGAAALRSNNPAAIVLYAETLLQSRQFDAAEEQEKRLEQLDPGNPFLTNLRARLILGRSKPAEAATALEESHLAKDNSAEAEQFGREIFPMILQMGPDAQAVAERLARRLAEHNPALSWMTASILASRARREEALALCRIAADAATLPADLREASRIALEIAVASVGETTALQRATEITETARRRAPESDDLRVVQAILNHLQGHFDEEVHNYRAVLAKQPRNPVVLNNLAWALSEGLNQPSEGLEKIDELLASTGRNAESLDTRGVILIRLGRLDEAVKDLTEALKLGSNGGRLYHLAKAYKKMGREEDFRRTFEEAKRAGLTNTTMVDPTERAEIEALLRP
jgi:tetratricopeptide (TPR) repeat protein